ncbi:MAG: hypothetical protein LBM98_13465 [Oscillospiraceae bacterium]|jgi:hypothetical protein|nr:hypothetical protein [Oscillospiraceae bacterium]
MNDEHSTQTTDYGEPADVFARAPRRFPARVIGLIAGVIVILAVVAISAVALKGSAYERAEMKGFEALMTGFEKSAAAGALLEFDLAFEPKADLGDLFGLGGLLGLDDSFAKSVAAGKIFGSIGADDARTLLSLGISGAGNELVTVNAYSEGSTLLADSPKLTDYVFAFDSGEDIETPKPLDSEKLKDSVIALAKWYFEKAKTAEVEKNTAFVGPLNASDYYCDAYTLKFYQADIYEFALLALDELQNNPELLDLIGQSGYIAEFRPEDIRTDLQELGGETGDLVFTMTTFIHNGVVVGRFAQSADLSASCAWRHMEQGGERGTEVNLTYTGGAGAFNFALKDKATSSENGWTGELTLATNAASGGDNYDRLTLAYENLNIDKQGLITGSASVNYNENDLDFELTFNLYTDETDRQLIELSGAIGGIAPGKLTLGYKLTTDYAVPEAPKAASDKIIKIPADLSDNTDKLDAFTEEAGAKLEELYNAEDDIFSQLVYEWLYSLVEQIYYSY